MSSGERRINGRLLDADPVQGPDAGARAGLGVGLGGVDAEGAVGRAVAGQAAGQDDAAEAGQRQPLQPAPREPEQDQGPAADLSRPIRSAWPTFTSLRSSWKTARAARWRCWIVAAVVMSVRVPRWLGLPGGAALSGRRGRPVPVDRAATAMPAGPASARGRGAIGSGPRGPPTAPAAHPRFPEEAALNRNPWLVATAALALATGAVAQQPQDDPPGVPVGAPAPAFTLKDQHGKDRSLAEFLGEGETVALVFYRSADW